MSICRVTSLNIAKTEVIIFKRQGRVFDTDSKLNLFGKKLFTHNFVKYLGGILDEHLH